MTEDEIIYLGSFAEVFLTNSSAEELIKLWETDCVSRMLSTGPLDGAVREKVYAQMVGTREFLAFLGDFAQKSRELQDKHGPKPEDIDDPSVHDIYRPDDQ